ncbi:MAG: rhamnan synthesis F family protein [Ruthenibacterium sp.]
MQRIAVYALLDAQGVVDDYVSLFLRELKQQTSRILVVCSAEIAEADRKKLEACHVEICSTQKDMSNLTAYCAGILQLGIDAISACDELICADSTLMGPVVPFAEMFSAMAQKQVDYWGIACHYGGFFKDISIAPHPETSFLVFRKTLMQTQEFYDIWKSFPQEVSVETYLRLFEGNLNGLFGKSWECYVNTDDLEAFSTQPMLFYAKELLRNRKCPVFLRSSFCVDYEQILNSSLGQPGRELYDYLRGETTYSMDLLWQHILRTMHQVDFRRNMQLNYILPVAQHDENLSKQVLKNRKIALVMHLYFMDLLEESLAYARSIPAEADVYITVNTPEKKALVESKFKTLPCSNLYVLQIQNRGRDVSSLLIGFAPYVNQYDYVCFVHDKKSVGCKPASVGESFGYACWENVLKNKEFVLNILNTFESNPHMGLLVPPPPSCGFFFSHLASNGWVGNFDQTKELIQKLNLKIPVSEDKMPTASYGSMFWFRADALRPLLDYHWKYEDFLPEPNHQINGTILHAIERIHPFVAQQSGYYPAIVMSSSFAAIQQTNALYCVETLQELAYRVIPENYFLTTKTQLNHIANLAQGIGSGAPSNAAQLNFSPYEMSHTRKLRNKLKQLFPKSLYQFMMKIKRALFGPHDGAEI